MTGLLEITNDVFDIADELKKIDSDYRVYYNKIKHRFEIHHLRYKPTLQLVVPYDTLDYRTVDFVQMTRVDRTAEPLDIDELNRIAEEKAVRKIKEDTLYMLKQL